MEYKTISTFMVEQSMNMWGNVQTFETNIGTFEIRKINHDINGNSRIAIVPIGFTVSPLPKLKGYRRNKDGYYTTQSINDSETMEHFLWTLYEQLKIGNRLYINFPVHTK